MSPSRGPPRLPISFWIGREESSWVASSPRASRSKRPNRLSSMSVAFGARGSWSGGQLSVRATEWAKSTAVDEQPNENTEAALNVDSRLLRKRVGGWPIRGPNPAERDTFYNECLIAAAQVLVGLGQSTPPNHVDLCLHSTVNPLVSTGMHL